MTSQQGLRVLSMAEAEAEAWYRDLMVHIRKQHPHLYDPENTGLSERGLLLVDLPYLALTNGERE